MSDKLTEIKKRDISMLYGTKLEKDWYWLEKQAEVLKKIIDTWIAIETKGTTEYADNFYTIVQDILSKGD